MGVILTNLTTNVNNIQGLSDRPNTIDGLTSAELKAKFDKAVSDIKEYINGTHIPQLEENFDNIISGMNQYVTTDDSRLTNSRICNNSFDNGLIARQNLKINYGTSLPSTGEDGDIFFLY